MAEIGNETGRFGATSQVVNFIRRAIQSGKLKVGDRLPNEGELANTIGVGRSSLREGMRILAAYGVVEIRQGEGTFVINRTAEQFFDFLGFMPNNSTLVSFIELRRVIETGNIVTVYDKLTQGDIVELQALVDRLDSKNGLEACVSADREFHKKLLTLSGNPLMIELDKMIYHMRSELLYRIMCYDEVVRDARQAHQKILDALTARDMLRCIQLVTSHLDTTAEHMRRLHMD